MMLKTSSNKVNPFSNMFGFTFKRNLGITVLVVVAFLLICPAYMLINLNNVETLRREDYFSVWNMGFSIFCAAATSVGVVGMNLLNFSFMFKRNSSDFTDSLPITRAELFLSKFLSGYVLVMIPSIISILSLSAVSLFFGFSSIALRALTNLLYIAVITAVCSAFSMIFIVASANGIDFIVSFIGVNAGLLVLGLIISEMLDELLIGYAGDSIWRILKAVSPIFYSFYGFAFYVCEETAHIGIVFLLKNIGMILAFGIISVLLYKKRKTESTGKAFAYKFIYIICAVLISACSSFAFGAVFENGVNFTSPIFYAFAFIGAIIASIIYGLITFRGFKTIKKSIVLGCISFALIVVSMVAVKLDFIGFTNKIPSKDSIKSVNVEYAGTSVDYTNPDFALKLHKKVITDKNVLVKNHNYGPHAHTINISYTLKDKKSLKRAYWVYDEYISDEISLMLKSDERFDGFRNLLKRTKPKTVNLYLNEENDIGETYLTYDEVMQFLAIYQNEAQSNTQKAATDGSYYNISWSAAKYYYDDFYYDDSYTETKAFLDSLKLEERVQKYENEECILYD